MSLFKSKTKKILIGDLYFKGFKRTKQTTIVTFSKNARTAKKFDDYNQADKQRKRIARNMKNVVNQTYNETLKQITII